MSATVCRTLLLLALLGSAAAAARAQDAAAPSRGRLLYETHCIACHDTQVHWRDLKQATDWASLQLQVRRWQSNIGLRWSEADIDDVAGHLNDTIYRFARPTGQSALPGRAGGRAG
jgi:mono/diheme cytochrome c family protein